MLFALRKISRGKIFTFLKPGTAVDGSFSLEDGDHEFFVIDGNSVTTSGSTALYINGKQRTSMTLAIGNVLKVVHEESSIDLEVLALAPEKKNSATLPTKAVVKAE